MREAMVRQKSRNIWPAMPPESPRGTNTARVVRVEAMTEDVTSLVPSTQALIRSWPSRAKRLMFSSTTMELSTIMPTPMAMPPRLIMFRVRSNTFISTNTDRIHTGMDTQMVKVGPPRRRNRKTTMAASTTPWMMLLKAAFTDWLIYSRAE